MRTAGTSGGRGGGLVWGQKGWSTSGQQKGLEGHPWVRKGVSPGVTVRTGGRQLPGPVGEHHAGWGRRGGRL